MADRAQALRQAAQTRHNATLARAEAALGGLVASGRAVSFAGLARDANVSRSWLYRQDELRAEVARHRQASPPSPRVRQQGQSASPASLRQQLHAYREEIARLRADNHALQDQLARRLGTERADNVTRR
jgi:hypothetical protein